MLVRAKDTFGIELEAYSSRVFKGKKWTFGHICYRIHDWRVGNYNQNSSLAVAAASFNEILAYSGKRSSQELMDMSRFELFKTIYHALFVDDSRSDEQVKSDWYQYSRFLAIPLGFDAFDGWKAFLIEDEFFGRFVWKETCIENSEIFEVKLQAGEFDKTIKLFLHKLESYEK